MGIILGFTGPIESLNSCNEQILLELAFQEASDSGSLARRRNNYCLEKQIQLALIQLQRQLLRKD